MDLLKANGLDDVLVVIGGIIPDVDVPEAPCDGRQGRLSPGNADAGDHRFHQRQRPLPGVTGAYRARWPHADRTKVPQTLLLADDSVTIQRVIELTFADEDIDVVAVSDGDQAIARLDADAARISCWSMSACPGRAATRSPRT